MTGDGHVTPREFSNAIEPMQRDIADIKKAVEPIPELVAQVTRLNGTVSELNVWRWLATGGGMVVALALGGGGLTYILMEVL